MEKYLHIKEIQEYLEYLKLDKSSCTISSYTYSIGTFFDFMEIENINDVGSTESSDCRMWQNNLKERGLVNSSINTNTRVLKALYNWMVDNGYVSKNPFLKIKELKTPKREIDYLSEQEEVSMINACKKIQDKLMIAMMITLGLRRDEVINIRVSDISEQRHITIFGKGQKERTLILQQDVYELLKKHLETRTNKSEYVFISNHGSKFVGTSVYRKIKSIAKKAGITPDRIDNIHPHLLRHTFATNLIECGTDIVVVQSALGHSSLNTTMIYAHVKNTTLDNAMLNQRSLNVS